MGNNDKLLTTINVQTGNIILTPLNCSFLISEILKALLYQKSQIPYPYTWLKNSLKKKRCDYEGRNTGKLNFTIERHFQMALTAYEASEEIMKQINQQFKTSKVFEILFLFGTTPVTVKEIYSVKFSCIASGHNENNHLNAIQKNQHKILRQIFLSDKWLNLMMGVLPPTNLYIMLRREATPQTTDFFTIVDGYTIPTHIPHTQIVIDYDVTKDTCCKNIQIYEDDSSRSSSEYSCITQSDPNQKDTRWYQARLFIRGYKDCFVDKVSVSELW